jgi:hypothetical protein
LNLFTPEGITETNSIHAGLPAVIDLSSDSALVYGLTAQQEYDLAVTTLASRVFGSGSTTPGSPAGFSRPSGVSTGDEDEDMDGSGAMSPALSSVWKTVS